jgi:hypothetical protein
MQICIAGSTSDVLYNTRRLSATSLPYIPSPYLPLQVLRGGLLDIKMRVLDPNQRVTNPLFDHLRSLTASLALVLALVYPPRSLFIVVCLTLLLAFCFAFTLKKLNQLKEIESGSIN